MWFLAEVDDEEDEDQTEDDDFEAGDDLSDGAQDDPQAKRRAMSIEAAHWRDGHSFCRPAGCFTVLRH